MNKKIKEILEYWKFYINEPSNYKLLNVHFDEIKKILDCITNLQQRIEYLERSNDRREDTIIGLRFEVAEQEDYKSRCKKAIEFIKNTDTFVSNLGKVYLLNILQGSEDNEC